MNERLHDMTPKRMLLDQCYSIAKEKQTLKIIEACTTATYEIRNTLLKKAQ